MAQRQKKTQTIAGLIADAVKAHFASAPRGPRAAARPTREVARRKPASRPARSPGRASSAPSTSAAASAPAAAPAAAAPSAGEASAAPTSASSLAAQRAAEKELLDRVRADLQAAYEGAPVSPERIAFRLKEDRDLVDAALTYLVRRKEARAKWVKGRPAYTPAFPH